MMTASETDTEDFDNKTADNSAIIEISSTTTSSIIKQHSNDRDYLSNYNTGNEDSIIASASIDSFSTLPEQDTSDAQFDNRDLKVKVDNPKKHLETVETYITFRITTKTTRSEFEKEEYVVRRRYNDFIWLHQKLVDMYPSHIIPPMPGKHSLIAQLDRYSKEFIIARMKLLHVFLNKVVNHPILSCDKYLKAFLTAQPIEFSTLRKNRNNIIDKVTDSLQNLASTYTILQRNLEFGRVRDYCNALIQNLAHLDKINNRINKERNDYIAELHQMYPIFNQWSASERELATLLLSIAKAVESNALAHQKLVENIPNEEREYIAYVESVKDALTRRDNIQIEYELTIDELSKRRNEKDQLLDNPNSSNRTQNWGNTLWKSESRDEKLERLGQNIPQLAKRSEVLLDRLDCANENLRSDIERWSLEKRNDLKNILLSTADRQIQLYQDCMEGWEKILTHLKFDGVSTDIQTIEKTISTQNNKI